MQMSPTQPSPPLDHEEGSSENEYDYQEPIWDQATLEAIDAIQNIYDLKELPTTPSHSDSLKINQNPSRLYYNFLHHRFTSLLPNLQNHSSLYSRFRAHRHFLSVSDLVSCIWCQYQVEYGLLGKRYLPPTERPKSIISSSGNEIKIDENLVFSRQEILDGGKRVHAKLEEEVALEHVDVHVISQVDIWALKVMNTIVNLSLLRSTGMMREIHVWGFVGGFLVQGVIDQIDLIPISSSMDDATTHSSSSSSNKKYNDEKSPSSGITPPIQESSERLVARISDTKTIQTSTLPPPEHTETPRYQLMLYKYLHDQNASGRFDLDKFSCYLGLDLDERFSAPFLKDIEPLLKEILKKESFQNDKEEEKLTIPNTLREMFKLYDRMIRMVGLSDETLEIVYRKRGSRGARQKKSTDGTEPKKLKVTLDQPVIETNSIEPTTPTPPPPISSKKIEARSNATSISPTAQHDESTSSRSKSKDVEKLIHGSTLAISYESNETITNKLQQEEEETKEESMEANKIEEKFSKFTTKEKMRGSMNEDYNKLGNIENDGGIGKIIGRYEFEFHPLEFFKFIWESVGFWNGDVEPIGVNIQQVNKCYSCEFKDGCEWRNKMSNQILDSLY